MNPKLEPFEQTSILGLRIDVVCLEDIISLTTSSIRYGEKALISYVNVQAVNLAYKNQPFRSFINSSRMVFCDGFGVKWAIRLIRGKKLQRLTPPDWFGHLAGESADHGFSMYFLGTQQAVVEKAAAVMNEKHPDLKILGVHHGFFDKSETSQENLDIVNIINTLRPDILVVGFGMPAQEKWIAENYDQLNVHVIFPVGAFFDYIAGEVVRAPRWMTDNGFEWLGRLIIEPGRLWKRYLVGNPLFIWRIFVHHILGVSLPNPADGKSL